MAATESGKRSNELGPIGEQLAENVRALRTDRNLSTRGLSERLAELGRPIPPSGLTRIEARQRRVDADDLVALAVALEVSPIRLLLPPDPTDADIPITPERAAPWAAAWRWVTGEQPLLSRGEEVPLDDPRVKEFIAENRPYENSPIREAYELLNKRVPAPFEATVTHETANLHHRVTWDEWQDGVNRGDR